MALIKRFGQQNSGSKIEKNSKIDKSKIEIMVYFLVGDIFLSIKSIQFHFNKNANIMLAPPQILLHSTSLDIDDGKTFLFCIIHCCTSFS